MINDCDVVRDLIPQFAENLVSDGTREFVEKHCSECPQCKEKLDAAFKALGTKDTEEERKEKIWDSMVKKERKRKRIMRTIISASAVFLVLIGIFSYSFLIKGNTWFTEFDLGIAENYPNAEQLNNRTHPGKDEVEAASEAVKKYFRNNFNACVLLRLAYDEDSTCDEEYQPLFPESIVFVSDYYSLTEPIAGNANRMSEGYRWIVNYNEKKEEWEVVGCGYG